MKKILIIFLFFSLLRFTVRADEEYSAKESQEEEYKVYIQEGIKCLEDEDYENAKSFFWKASEINPENPDSYVNLAIVHINENNLERAIELLNKAEKLARNDYQKKEILYYNLGLCYFLNLDYKNAIEYFKNALKIYPDFGEAFYYLAKNFDVLENGREALINSIKAKNIFLRKSQEDYLKKADELFYTLKEKFNISSSQISVELVKEVDSIIDNNNLAKGLLEEAISFDSKNSLAYYKLALIYIKENSPVEGVELLKTAYNLNPNDNNIALSLGELYVKFKRYEEALDIFNKVMLKDKNNPRALYDLGFLYKELGKDLKSKEYFSKANSISKEEEIFSFLKEKIEPKNIQAIQPIKKERFRSFYTSDVSSKKNKGVFKKGFYIGEPSLDKKINKFQKTYDY